MEEIAKLTLEEIIEHSKRGEFGLLHKLLESVHPTILEKVAPDHLKQQLEERYIGKDIFFVKIHNLDGTIQYKSDVDYMTCYTWFNEQLSKNIAEVFLCKSKIIGGSLNKWIFDENNYEQLKMSVVDSEAVDSFHFKSYVTLEISGVAKGNTSEGYIRDQMTVAVTPLFVFSNILESSTQIKELKIEI